jgi:hypothetical protein
MKPINYRGSILSALYKALEQNEEMTTGEILYSFLRKENMQGKHFFYSSDQEIYNALERFNKIEEEEDEPMNEIEFNLWISNK